MEKNGDSDSPGWGASFIMHTSEEIARAVCSSKEDGGGHLQKLQNQVFQVLKGLSQPTEEKSTYNPEVLTTQKRQWDSFQLQALHRRILKEPSRLFESIVVVGLHPNSDIQSGSGRLQNAINGQRQSTLAVTNLEPQGADDSILISTEERLEQLRQSISGLDLESSVEYANGKYIEDKACGISAENGAEGMLKGTTETVRLSRHDSITETNTDDKSLMVDHAAITDSCKQESVSAEPVSKSLDGPVYDIVDNNQPTQRHIPNVILPLLRYQHHDSSKSSSRFMIVDQVVVKHKTVEVQSKIANVIFVDVNKNQVKSSSLPVATFAATQRTIYILKSIPLSACGRKLSREKETCL
ncbi:hypothetical protein SSX86_004273 [Deinandra increscens subsp. villosa]|uniref:Uncharacterized protein n=1 Tax=Deinandra increscens subsp. villosa TaxID=3103831 RepID=A0AAP0H5S4_9ASTR